jgi:hypothetical protein
VPARPVSEATVERHLVEGIRARGGVAEKTVSPGKRGFFDRVVVVAGRVFFVETKKPSRGRLTPHQKYRHDEFRAAGATVLVLHSVVEVESFLRRLDGAAPQD